MTDLDRRDGSSAFGHSPQEYDAVRPDYPAWMFEEMSRAKFLQQGTRTLEIGPGSGLATRQLIANGASPLTLIEPDRRFAQSLEGLADADGNACNVIYEPFESTRLTPAGFDLVVAATAFHWLNPDSRVAEIARLLKPGGGLALMWHVFQNLQMADPFHEATSQLLSQLPNSPSGAPDTVPFALDRTAREEELTKNETFSLTGYQQQHWPLILKSKEIRFLYGGFSSLYRLPAADRTALLDELETIARENFDDTVTRNMTSVMYLFRRN